MPAERLRLLSVDKKKPGLEILHPAQNTFSRTHVSYGYYLMQCFAEHYGAVITPDLVWFTVLGTFASYVAKHAEEMRDKFVNHAGKKTIAFFPESDKMDDLLGTYLKGVAAELKIDAEIFFPEVSACRAPDRS